MTHLSHNIGRALAQLVAALTLALAASNSYCAVHVCVDARGKEMYTDKPCADKGETTSRVFRTVDLEEKTCGELGTMVQETLEKVDQVNRRGPPDSSFITLQSELEARKSRFERHCGRAAPSVFVRAQSPASATAESTPAAGANAQVTPAQSAEAKLAAANAEARARKAARRAAAKAAGEETYDIEYIFGVDDDDDDDGSSRTVRLLKRFWWVSLPFVLIPAFFVYRSRKVGRKKQDQKPGVAEVPVQAEDHTIESDVLGEDSVDRVRAARERLLASRGTQASD